MMRYDDEGFVLLMLVGGMVGVMVCCLYFIENNINYKGWCLE